MHPSVFDCRIAILWPLAYQLLRVVSTTRHEIKSSESVEVEIDTGRIRGERLKMNHSIKTFDVFKGIPYAAAPRSDFRFKKPTKSAAWRGVMNVTMFGPACTQRSPSSLHYNDSAFIKLNEDCLSLNIFAPSPEVNVTYAVVFFIHGGDFQRGASAEYGQDPILYNFARHDVIFVSINYRLGPFGFASTGDDLMKGNYGLWDMVYALEWVQINIEKFSGDPNQVTIMGHGSGAGACSLLALSPKTRKLFKQVIMLSGSSNTPGLVRTTAVNATWNLQQSFGCLAQNSTSLVACFLQKGAEVIDSKEFLTEFRKRVYYDDYEEFVPRIDNEIIDFRPETLIIQRPSSTMPILIGTTRDESVLRLMIHKRYGKNYTVTDVGGLKSDITNITMTFREFKNKLLIDDASHYNYIYSRLNPRLDTDKVLVNSTFDYFSDFWYHAPATREIMGYLKNRNKNVFAYSFDHSSTHSYIKEFPEDRSIFHSADLMYLFDFEYQFMKKRNDQYSAAPDKSVADIFATYLTNFIKYGNPNPECLPDSEMMCNPEANWTAVDKDKFNYLSISTEPKALVGFHYGAHIFWNNYVATELEDIDVGGQAKIKALRAELDDYQLATWVLLSSAVFFLAILVGLTFYCTRKDSDDDDDI